MSQPTMPNLDSTELEAIIPVAEQRVTDDVTITVMTLERYADGFLINIRLDWVGSLGPLPELAWRARDDQGSVYTCMGGCGGSGGGPRPDPETDLQLPRPNSWRMHCSFGPGIDGSAAQLVLELEKFRLNQPILADDGSWEASGWEQTREATDLGQFVISL